jgi:hypothetical protein
VGREVWVQAEEEPVREAVLVAQRVVARAARVIANPTAMKTPLW